MALLTAACTSGNSVAFLNLIPIEEKTPVANEELGTKRDCPECGARFYDLKREPALCPKCGHEFTPELILKPRRSRADDEAPKPANPAKANEEEDEDYEPEEVASLDDADQENAPASSSRKGNMDDEGTEDEDSEDMPIAEDDDTTILDDEDDGSDLTSVVTKPDDVDDR